MWSSTAWKSSGPEWIFVDGTFGAADVNYGFGIVVAETEF